MVKLNIDNSGNTMGGSVTIADLAQFSFSDQCSDHLTVYEAQDILLNDWRWEVVASSIELENGLGIRAAFKDGSRISISAWADCCNGEGHCSQCWDGVTRFSKRKAA